MTLKLWADQEGDGERSCCSPQAVLGARAWPTRSACRTSPWTSRRFRAAVVDDYVAEHDRGPHSEPLRALQRARALRRDAGAGGPPRRAALATGHYARIGDDGEDRC